MKLWCFLSTIQYYCVFLLFKNFVFSFCIYKTLSTGWLVKYKRYCKYVFEEMKTLHQQCYGKVGITWRLNLFSLASHIVEWPLLCS